MTTSGGEGGLDVGCVIQPQALLQSTHEPAVFTVLGGLPGGSQLQRRDAGTHPRCLKIGYPCCLRFARDESYTVDLFFSTKSRLGGISGVDPHFRVGLWC